MNTHQVDKLIIKYLKSVKVSNLIKVEQIAT